jgi:hypothetical protein
VCILGAPNFSIDRIVIVCEIDFIKVVFVIYYTNRPLLDARRAPNNFYVRRIGVTGKWELGNSHTVLYSSVLIGVLRCLSVPKPIVEFVIVIVFVNLLMRQNFVQASVEAKRIFYAARIIRTIVGSGKVDVRDLCVTKYIDSSSSPLMLACCKGTHFPSALLTVRKAGGESPVEYVKIKMDEVFITSVSTGAPAATV